MENNGSENESHLLERVWRRLIGTPRSIEEPSLFQKISLIPVLAWIGLGADGLSSSSYGPEEAFKTLGAHTYLAVLLALATALTVFVISYAYSRIIEHFPHGGGGYIVASHTIGSHAGVVSGCALLVDYMLTITVSLASCGDAVFSFFPVSFHHLKPVFVIFLILVLIILNLRGVKESVTVLAPIFFIFLVTHALLIGNGLFTHVGRLGPVVATFQADLMQDLSTIGLIGVSAVFLRAFSIGGGTYTGIEAVSNGIQIMRDPKVQTGKRTMAYMAVSLALTAGGLLVCYCLFDIKPVQGRTMNAVLSDAVFSDWPVGNALELVTILSEGMLLFVAAQAGFVDGPRVMANMAIDGWLPRRFAALSERLTMQNGVFLMGGAASALLVYTGGSISHLVVMYAINVFITFSLSQLGMTRFFLQNRDRDKKWKRHIVVHILGLFLCLTILLITVFEKFTEGGWVTLLITSAFLALCYAIRRHYKKVREDIKRLETDMVVVPKPLKAPAIPIDPTQMTAIILVSGYNGFGLHLWLSIMRHFPGIYVNCIFVSVAEIDSGVFKGIAEVERLKSSVQSGLEKYVTLTRSEGLCSEYRMGVGTDVVDTATQICEGLAHEFPMATVFAGKVIFRHENLLQKVLHNETALAIQRRLLWKGVTMVVLPMRIHI
ncbi:Amino acid permease-associated region [uncultured Desulfobacterium sp.]|uniref:Amino acid permease-associated region n=1 Tax=uncultured Desulfobacterium sp. TaxID=201089 RepID=A0A445N3V0_9BACT|nr:Amino acid permease-associated region [uncultured Desulfobacterium sp.]